MFHVSARRTLIPHILRGGPLSLCSLRQTPHMILLFLLGLDSLLRCLTPPAPDYLLEAVVYLSRPSHFQMPPGNNPSFLAPFGTLDAHCASRR